MSILVLGVSHHSAPIGILERLVSIHASHAELSRCLMESSSVDEVMILATCNRLEIYAVVTSAYTGREVIYHTLGDYLDMPVGQLQQYCYHYEDQEAVRHLFAVSCGLDSAIIGEQQILGQVRRAYAMAEANQSIGCHLHELIQRALKVGKLVHSRTSLAAAGTSVVSVAVDIAQKYLGPYCWDRACGVVIGAGSAGYLAAHHLIDQGISQLWIVNRSLEGAHQLARKITNPLVSIHVGLFDQLSTVLSHADIVLCATGALSPVIYRDDIPLIRRELTQVSSSGSYPLVICDLGVPHNVDHEVATLPGVVVVNMDQLLHHPAAHVAAVDTQQAWSLIEHAVETYMTDQKITELIPMVTALRQRAADVVSAELLRLEHRLPDLDTLQKREIIHTINRVVDKLLHSPTMKVKQLADSPNRESYIEVICELFELNHHNTAMTSPCSTIATSGCSSGYNSTLAR